MTRRVGLALVLGLAVLVQQGCGDAYYPERLSYSFTPYHLKSPDGKSMQTITLDADQAEELSQALETYFGTPRNPIVAGLGYEGDESGVKPFEVRNASGSMATVARADAENARSGRPQQLQLSPQTLKEGSRVYRQNCLYCHGLNGDGAGPTGAYLDPRPRDFRLGQFKFRSTVVRDSRGEMNPGALTRPSREDLKRTIREGVPTANMPSFRTLSEAEIDQATSYVIHLSLRGMVQFQLAGYLRSSPGSRLTPGRVRSAVEQVVVEWFQHSWSVVEASAPPDWFAALNDPELRRQRLKEGRELYMTKGACYQCHGIDGRSSPREIGEEEARRLNEWGEPNPPRDLTTGAFRGGSRPIDLFHRIRLGIIPSGMRANDVTTLSDEEIWKLVQYVLSLSEQKYPYAGK